MAVMESGFVEDFGRRWQDAVNRHAVEEILELCAEDIRIDDPGLVETGIGRQAVRELFGRTWGAFPDLLFTRPERPYLFVPDAPVAVARWSASGTMGGTLDPLGYAPTKSPVQFHGIDVWEFDDGLVTYWEGIYDLTGIARQIGALPPVGSHAERLGVLFQKLTARRMRRAAD
jgi:predicted ester cyclase